MSARHPEADPVEPSYFEFRDGAGDRFVIALIRPEQIDQARAILAGDEPHRVHVSGLIVPERAPYNPRWRFHLRPDSIRFFEFAIEVCDAAIRFVDEHLDEVGGSLLPGGHWCPWSSQLTREIDTPGPRSVPGFDT